LYYVGTGDRSVAGQIALRSRRIGGAEIRLLNG
jgi:hypothetical protein